jgi:hypothetical protein
MSERGKQNDPKEKSTTNNINTELGFNNRINIVPELDNEEVDMHVTG